MIIIVTQTPSKHLISVFFCHLSSSSPLAVSIEKIHVFRIESTIIRKMQIEVVIGDRARVSE